MIAQVSYTLDNDCVTPFRTHCIKMTGWHQNYETCLSVNAFILLLCLWCLPKIFVFVAIFCVRHTFTTFFTLTLAPASQTCQKLRISSLHMFVAWAQGKHDQSCFQLLTTLICCDYDLFREPLYIFKALDDLPTKSLIHL